MLQVPGPPTTPHSHPLCPWTLCPLFHNPSPGMPGPALGTFQNLREAYGRKKSIPTGS